MNPSKEKKAIESRPYTIAVDLDGTLAEYDYWRGIYHIGKLIKSTNDKLKAKTKKHKDLKVIIHTARINSFEDDGIIPESIEIIQNWLDYNNIKYDSIWTGCGKPYADEYWDDKAVKI